MNSCNTLYGFLVLILAVIVCVAVVNRGRRKYLPPSNSDKERLSRLKAYSFGFPTYQSYRFGYPWWYRRAPHPYYSPRHYYGWW